MQTDLSLSGCSWAIGGNNRLPGELPKTGCPPAATEELPCHQLTCELPAERARERARGAGVVNRPSDNLARHPPSLGTSTTSVENVAVQRVVTMPFLARHHTEQNTEKTKSRPVEHEERHASRQNNWCWNSAFQHKLHLFHKRSE